MEYYKMEVQDFICDGTTTYSDKIKYIASELEESANVDSYEDENWNSKLGKIASILYKASEEIKAVEEGEE